MACSRVLTARSLPPPWQAMHACAPPRPSMQKCRWSALTPDLAVAVLLEAGGPADASHARLVCRQWQQALDALAAGAALQPPLLLCQLPFLAGLTSLQCISLLGICQPLPQLPAQGDPPPPATCGAEACGPAAPAAPAPAAAAPAPLAALLASLAALPRLTSLSLSTWCLAQPCNDAPCTALVPGAAAAAGGGWPQPQYMLVVPPQLGLLTGLTQLQVAPCPEVSAPCALNMVSGGVCMCYERLAAGCAADCQRHGMAPSSAPPPPTHPHKITLPGDLVPLHAGAVPTGHAAAAAGIPEPPQLPASYAPPCWPALPTAPQPVRRRARAALVCSRAAAARPLPCGAGIHGGGRRSAAGCSRSGSSGGRPGPSHRHGRPAAGSSSGGTAGGLLQGAWGRGGPCRRPHGRRRQWGR